MGVRISFRILLGALLLLWAGEATSPAEQAHPWAIAALPGLIAQSAAPQAPSEAPPDGSRETGIPQENTPFQPAQPDQAPPAGEAGSSPAAQQGQATPAAMTPQGPVVPAVAPEAPEAQQAGAERMGDGDWKRGALEGLYPDQPITIRVAVLNASGKAGRAGMVAFLLEEYRGKELARKLGKKIAVVNLSNLGGSAQRDSVIYYRPGFLRAALIMAKVIPGKQFVTPMPASLRGKIGVDVEIRLGLESP